MRIVLTLALLSGSLLLLNAVAGEPGPEIPRGQGDHCVADTDYMRRNHMDLLTHQRDDTVIRGIRSEPFSIVDCVDCHVQKNASGEPIRIDAEGQFCQSCHAYAAVKIDCFGCHAATPDQAALEQGLEGTSSNNDFFLVADIQHHLTASIEASPSGSSAVEATHLSNFASDRYGPNRLLRD